MNVVGYSLLLSVLEYQTAVMRQDFETAKQVWYTCFLGTVMLLYMYVSLLTYGLAGTGVKVPVLSVYSVISLVSELVTFILCSAFCCDVQYGSYFFV